MLGYFAFLYSTELWQSDIDYRIFEFDVHLWYFAPTAIDKISQTHVKLKDPVAHVRFLCNMETPN